MNVLRLVNLKQFYDNKEHKKNVSFFIIDLNTLCTIQFTDNNKVPSDVFLHIRRMRVTKTY